MSTETVEAQRSLFEAKSRAELIDIATAMGGQPSQRSRKAELVDMIVELAGFGADGGAVAGDGAAGTETAAPGGDGAEASAPAAGEVAGTAAPSDGGGAAVAGDATGPGPSNGSE
ncbi:MAG: hypothetical protein OXP08_06130, partial [bacterium]|nr:hypothetical protein [bacterium]